MAKKALLTTEDGKYHKIKKGYLTVNNVYRRVKKAYVTIGGVYRPCWSGGEPAYYGVITPLSVARHMLSATTVGNYALFGGGHSEDGYSNEVDAYNTSLTRSTPTALSVARIDMGATTVGNYALFGGGLIQISPLTSLCAVDIVRTVFSPSLCPMRGAHRC